MFCSMLFQNRLNVFLFLPGYGDQFCWSGYNEETTWAYQCFAGNAALPCSVAWQQNVMVDVAWVQWTYDIDIDRSVRNNLGFMNRVLHASEAKHFGSWWYAWICSWVGVWTCVQQMGFETGMAGMPPKDFWINSWKSNFTKFHEVFLLHFVLA